MASSKSSKAVCSRLDRRSRDDADLAGKGCSCALYVLLVAEGCCCVVDTGFSAALAADARGDAPKSYGKLLEASMAASQMSELDGVKDGGLRETRR